MTQLRMTMMMVCRCLLSSSCYPFFLDVAGVAPTVPLKLCFCGPFAVFRKMRMKTMMVLLLFFIAMLAFDPFPHIKESTSEPEDVFIAIDEKRPPTIGLIRVASSGVSAKAIGCTISVSKPRRLVSLPRITSARLSTSKLGPVGLTSLASKEESLILPGS